MTFKTLYTKGYLIRVTSWENDGDNYRTKESQVETEEQARQLAEFAWLFADDIGNLYDPNETELAMVETAFQEFYAKHPNFFGETSENPEYISDWFMETAYDLGLSGSEDFYTRVCDKVEVYIFDNDVVVEDVSKEFK